VTLAFPIRPHLNHVEAVQMRAVKNLNNQSFISNCAIGFIVVSDFYRGDAGL
jgi:hypothetical protein